MRRERRAECRDCAEGNNHRLTLGDKNPGGQPVKASAESDAGANFLGEAGMAITNKAIVRLFKRGRSILGIMTVKNLSRSRVENAIRQYLHRER